MRILVTGAAGFIGSWVADSLIKAGHVVFGIDDLSGGSLENYSGKYLINTLNLIDGKAVKDFVRKLKVPIIYHFASCAREGASQFQPKYVTETNMQAFINIIEPAIKFGLKKLIFASSMAVYGKQRPPFNEIMDRAPVDIYGVNKAAIEQTIEILADIYEFKYVIIRPHNVFGERQRLKDKFRNVIAIFMNRIMRNEPLFIYGDGGQRRAFSYIQNSLPCFLRCLDNRVEDEIINLGGEQIMTVNELAEIICEAFGIDFGNYQRIYLPSRPKEVRDAWTTSEKSKKLLGYRETVNMQDGIRKMAKWAKRKGPQEWTDEKMPLESPKMPRIWR